MKLDFWQITPVATFAIFIAPVFIVLFSLAGDYSDNWTHLYNHVLFGYIENSIYLVLGVSIMVAIIGVGTAWLITNYNFTGKKIGFKPAGGISTSKSVLEFLILVAEELGFEWVNPKLLRIGASSLLIDIERQLYHYTSGRYANKEKLAIG